MKQVYGNHLSERLKREVLNAYGYRWTVENRERARNWYGRLGTPTMPLITDEEWLACTEFWVTNAGELSNRHRYCTSHR